MDNEGLKFFESEGMASAGEANGDEVKQGFYNAESEQPIQSLYDTHVDDAGFWVTEILMVD